MALVISSLSSSEELSSITVLIFKRNEIKISNSEPVCDWSVFSSCVISKSFKHVVHFQLSWRALGSLLWISLYTRHECQTTPVERTVTVWRPADGSGVLDNPRNNIENSKNGHFYDLCEAMIIGSHKALKTSRDISIFDGDSTFKTAEILLVSWFGGRRIIIMELSCVIYCLESLS